MHTITWRPRRGKRGAPRATGHFAAKIASPASSSKRERYRVRTRPLLDLAELERPALEAALDERGHRALPRAADLPVDLPTRRHRRRRDDRPAARAARDARRRLHADDARDRRARAVDRRHREVPAAARRRPADRIGLHPRHAGDDLLHLDAGRLRDGVRVLPDRQDGPRPQPDRRRNRRPGARARRRARPARQDRSTSC